MGKGTFKKELSNLIKKAHNSCVKHLEKIGGKYVFNGPEYYYNSSARVLYIYTEEKRIFGLLAHKEVCDLSYDIDLIFIADLLNETV